MKFANQNKSRRDTDEKVAFLRELLSDCSLPRDALPYTAEFDRLRIRFQSHWGEPIGEFDFWRLVSNTAKLGGLSTQGKKKSAPRLSKLTVSEKLEILRLFPDGIGNRDHLPYTNKLDDLRRRFNSSTGKKLTKYEFWRSVSSVAKLSRKPKPVFEKAPQGNLEPGLVEFLERNNPWWRAQPAPKSESYRRWAYSELMQRLKSRLAKIVVLSGSRRVGKSVIENQFIEELLLLGGFDSASKPVDASRILFVQFDNAPGLGSLTNPIEAIVRYYEENVLKSSVNASARRGAPCFLLFDEVQNLPNWSAQLKILADHSDAVIVVTGSSALRIAAGQDNLAGRMTTIELGPLRLTEIAGLRGLAELPSYAASTPLEAWKTRDFWLRLVAHGQRFAKGRLEAFSWFSQLGGYPLCHAGKASEIESLRQQIVTEVITKTIEHDPGRSPRGVALQSSFLREVFRIACRYAGQSVLPQRFVDEIQITSRIPISIEKVQRALEFLADSLLLCTIKPLEMLAKRQAHPSKICICDHFVRNGVLQETIPIAPEALADCDQAVATQVGHLLESVIGYYLRGIPGIELGWFPERKNEPEVDFVLTIGLARIPIEVKYRRSNPSGADIAGIEAFCSKEAYGADFGIIVTQKAEGPIGDRAIAVPASTFLLLR